MHISHSTICDVRNAFDNRSSEMDLITGDWIYGVDPETMGEVKAFYKTLDGNNSLYSSFCKILKYSRKNNIKF